MGVSVRVRLALGTKFQVSLHSETMTQNNISAKGKRIVYEALNMVKAFIDILKAFIFHMLRY